MNEVTQRQISILEEIQSIPVAPFSIENMKEFIINHLDKMKIPYESDRFAITVKSKQFDKAKQKTLILAHVDHPGIVLKENGTGIFFGTPYSKRLARILEKEYIPLTIYNKKTNTTSQGKLIAIRGSSVQIETSYPLSNNSIAQYDIHLFSENDRELYVYNADNGASVATLLTFILEQYNNIETSVLFVFTLHEEVHQLSAWHLAKTNRYNITPDDHILNLECLTVNNINESDFKANYDDGIILQLSNRGCHFGYHFKERNQLEDRIKITAKKLNIPLQIGVINDSCDSRPFSFFPITPHICTLTIPNEFKHNKGVNGEVVPEKIIKKDFTSQLQILHNMVMSERTEVPDETNISERIRSNDTVTSPNLMYSKAILNERLNIAYHPAVERGYYYAENLIDLLSDTFYKFYSYLFYVYYILYYKAKNVTTKDKQS